MCCSKKAWSMASDAQPSVTKLNGPSRVVIGPNGPELHTGDDEGKEAPSSQPEQGPAMLREANQPRQGVRWALQSTAGSEAVRPGTVDYTKFERFLLSEGSSSEFEQEVVGDNVGGSSKPEAPGTLVAGQRQPESSEERRLTRNGGKEEGHWWAQDRDEVTVHVKVPPMLRGPQVKVKAVARRLTAWVEAGASQEVLVDRELAGSVQESEDGYLDEWEITRTCGMSFLSIPLRFPPTVGRALAAPFFCVPFCFVFLPSLLLTAFVSVLPFAGRSTR